MPRYPRQRLDHRRLAPPRRTGNGHYGVPLSLAEAVIFVGCSRISVVKLLRFWGLPNVSIPSAVLEANLDELTQTEHRRVLSDAETEAAIAWRNRYAPGAPWLDVEEPPD